MPGPAKLLPRSVLEGPLTLPARRTSRFLRLRQSCGVARRPVRALPPLLPLLGPTPRLLPLVLLRPAVPLPRLPHLARRVVLPPGGLPRAAARAASRALAGPSWRPRSRLPTLGSPSMDVVLPSPTTTTPPAARTFEGRLRQVLLLQRGRSWSPEWWQPQEMHLPPPSCLAPRAARQLRLVRR